MSDSDDDLLALAGAGDSSEDESANVRSSGGKKSIRADSKESNTEEGEEGDEEEDDNDDYDDELNHQRFVGSEDDDDNHEVYVNPYPIEGKYKDEEDQERLEAMTEIERESILFERSQEMQKYNEKLYLEQRARERKQVEKALQKTKERSTRTSDRGKSGPQTKKTKLSELKQKRQEKHTRAKSRAQGIAVPYRKLHESEDSEFEEDGDEDDYDRGRNRKRSRKDDSDYSEDEYGDNGTVEWADSGKGSKELSVEHINKVRFGKTLLAKFCHYPEFEEVIQGCFVRVNIGMNRDKQTFTYRVCQVRKVVASPKPYTFLNRTVGESLLVAHGSSEKIFEMGICSDKPITEEEFNWWKSVMNKKNLMLPSPRAIERKLNRLVEMQRRTLSSEEIDEIIKRRQALSSDSFGANTVIEKSMLQQKRQIALENGDFTAVDDIDNQIASLDRILNRNTKRAEIDRLARVNERNRRANMDDIRKAEVIAHEARRKAELVKDTSNPFARLRTSARIFYESRSESPKETSTEPTTVKEEAPVNVVKTVPVKTGKLSTVDDVIANLDLGLEIEI